ncbi:MAG: synthase (F/14-kDa) subunit [Verrucomicrobiota bacterium]|jgi:vacuolar-type H+-ATPase subunit F/Vma7
MQIRCLGDEDTVRGFRLAGVTGTVVDDPVQAVERLRLELNTAGVALVLITVQVAAWVRGEDGGLLERERPLVMVMPGMHESVGGLSDLGRLVEGAIGVRVEKGI